MWSAQLLNRFRIDQEGKTGTQRVRGRTSNKDVCHFGEKVLWMPLPLHQRGDADLQPAGVSEIKQNETKQNEHKLDETKRHERRVSRHPLYPCSVNFVWITWITFKGRKESPSGMDETLPDA